MNPEKKYEKWLEGDAKELFLDIQIDKAKNLILPEQFSMVPGADYGEKGALCITWRSSPWTLSIEISKKGDEEWWVYNTDTKEYYENETEIRNLFLPVDQ